MSRVKSMIANRKQAAELLPARLEDRRMTLRLSGLSYGALLLIAGEVEDTPTGLAQDILSEALEDALQGIGYEDFNAAIPDIVDLLDRNKKLQEQWESSTIDGQPVQRDPDPEERAILMANMRENGQL